MTQIPSTNMVNLDVTSRGLQMAARDMGEVIALLAGGTRPDPDDLSRLHLSMRAVQAFLLEEARQQKAREDIAREIDADDVLVEISRQLRDVADRAILKVREVFRAPV